MTMPSYDDVPYPNQAYANTHIRNLETIGLICGIQPKPITQCRVLEIGCAAGWNLLPQAVDFPNSEFVGMDLSEKQTQMGKEVVEKLGQHNVEIRCADIMDIDESWGKYDYIICHGVYSWAPVAVQEKILKVCKANLSPNGIALVSYNALPGWHFNRGLREIMLYHVQNFSDPQQQISQSREILKFLASETTNEAYKGLLIKEYKLLSQHKDNYLYHDYLEEHNYPIYFYQFVEYIEKNGLQYLANTNLLSMLSVDLSKAVKDVFKTLNHIQREQYRDFLYNNKFRSTMICHNNLVINHIPFEDIFKGYHIIPKKHIKVRDIPKKTPDEVLRLMERVDRAWPESIPIDDVPTTIKAFWFDLIKVSHRPLIVTNRVSQKPIVSPLTRVHLKYGNVINQRHESITVDNFSKVVMGQLDGTNDKEAIVDKIYDNIKKGHVTFHKKDTGETDISRTILDGLVENALKSICNSGFLIK